MLPFFSFLFFFNCKFGRTKIMVVLSTLGNKGVDMVYLQCFKANGSCYEK